MPDPATRFIGLATRSLEGDAKEIAATELAARLAHAGADDGELVEAAARLKKAGAFSGSRGLWVLGFAVVGLAVLLAVLIPQHWREARLLEGVHRQGRDGKLHERVLAEMGPAAADVPLRTDYQADKKAWSDAVEALLREDPNDPARYFLYVLWEGLPSDFDSRWRELDPGNALWGVNAANTLTSGSLSLGGFNGPTVIDESRFQRAISMFREAAKCDHSRSWFVRIRERQLRSFAYDGSLMSITMQSILVELTGHPFRVDSFSISRALGVQSRRFVAAGDREGMQALVRDLRRVLILTARDRSDSLEGILPSLGFVAREQAASCIKLGLVDEAEWLRKLADTSNEIKLRRFGMPVANRESSRSSGSLEKSARGLRFTVPTAGDLKPGRLAEYAVADRFTALAGVLAAFLVAAAGLIEILRRGPLPRRLAGGLMPLFRASDWAWLFGLGLVLPAIWWFGITWYSPLGCRDIGLTFFEIKGFPMMQPWLSQGLGGLVLAFVMLVQTARWRLGKRGAFLSLRPPRMWIGWTMAVLAALFIPAMGIVRYLSADQDKFLLYGSAAGGIALLWLLWQAAMGLFAARENALGGQVLLRLLMPGVIGVALLLLSAMPLLRKAERKWVAELEGYSRSPSGHLINPVQVREADRIRKALLEALE